MDIIMSQRWHKVAQPERQLANRYMAIVMLEKYHERKEGKSENL
jgi:hypothetical protein